MSEKSRGSKNYRDILLLLFFLGNTYFLAAKISTLLLNLIRNEFDTSYMNISIVACLMEGSTYFRVLILVKSHKFIILFL